MTITKNDLIGEVVAKDYRAASVFKVFNIDFCCNGNRSIGLACDEAKLDPEEVLGRLIETTTTNDGPQTDYQSWDIDLLAEFIEKKHHRYVENRIGEIRPYLDKICQVHGRQHPELAEIRGLFAESAGELAVHMKKEELILFPFIKKMVDHQRKGESMPRPHFGKLEDPIAMMHDDHDHEGERFRKIAELSRNYSVPPDACNTYRVTLALLKEFEEDLHLHIHLENNILFPKALALEAAVRDY